MKLTEIGEFGLIERLGAVAAGTLAAGVRGVGDDCAVIPMGAGAPSLVVTTDTMVEGRHFRWEFTSAFDLGWKLLAVNLSDLAAAGAKPLAAVMTLQLRDEIEAEAIEELYRGAAELAGKYGVSIAGGDTTASMVVAVGATLIGLAELPLGRAGAKPGDDVWVSGIIGLGGAGLALARAEISPDDFPDGGAAASEKYCKPEPRCALGRELADRGLATAAIDISDGLFQDAGRVSERSGVRIEIDLARVPFSSLRGSFDALRACTSGDDYELLFTAPPEMRADLESISGSEGIPPLTLIGFAGQRQAGSGAEVFLTSGSGVRDVRDVLTEAGLVSGFDHFRR